MVLVPVAVAYVGGKWLAKEADGQIVEYTEELANQAIEDGAVSQSRSLRLCRYRLLG